MPERMNLLVRLDGLPSVRIGHPIILNEQPLRQQKEECVMTIVGTIGLVFALICILSIIAAAVMIYVFLVGLEEFLGSL